MERGKLTNRGRHESPIETSTTPSKQDQKEAARSAGKRAVRKKAPSRTVNPARPLGKVASKSKSEKLVCRYCGSDDLAPSFIKRRDRRCRKCFSKRYNSVARARKGKVRK
jgi:hypothetical protein